jgi:hypothetical protein
MQHGVSGRLDGRLEHGSDLLHRALLVLAVGLAVLVVSWIAYLVLVAALILWG